VCSPFNAPASLLAHLFGSQESPVELAIISGPSGAGKTTWCLRLVEKARGLGLEVAGLISQPVMARGQKIGIDLVDQATGARRRLAVPRRESDDGLLTGAWRFDPLVLDWGNHLLLNLPPCDLFILDELGPLEFHRGQGLLAGLTLLTERRPHLSCVVVRQSLLPLARDRWPWSIVLDLSLTGQAAGSSGGEG